MPRHQCSPTPLAAKDPPQESHQGVLSPNTSQYARIPHVTAVMCDCAIRCMPPSSTPLIPRFRWFSVSFLIRLNTTYGCVVTFLSTAFSSVSSTHSSKLPQSTQICSVPKPVTPPKVLFVTSSVRSGVHIRLCRRSSIQWFICHLSNTGSPGPAPSLLLRVGSTVAQ